MTVFAIILGLIYFLAGAAKLAGAKPLAEQFDEFGLGRSMMRAIGLAEVAAAIGLQIDRLDALAGGGMVAMMIGALYFHRRVDHPTQSLVPATAVLMASLAFVLLVV